MAFRSIRDSPRSVAAVTEFLHSKNLHVVNIDDVNVGLDCFYCCVKYGLRAAAQDQLSFVIDNVRPNDAVHLGDMSVQEMRTVAARTVEFFATSEDAAYSGMRQRLQLHVAHEVLPYLGPDGQGRIPANSSVEEGTTTIPFCEDEGRNKCVI
jgi:hypothetical protein